ncbi:hypothetical protein J7J84_02085 [bacterium]|nr:hypothetical protein [bacterium]
MRKTISVSVMAASAALLLALTVVLIPQSGRSQQEADSSTAPQSDIVAAWNAFADTPLDVDFSECKINEHSPDSLAYLRGKGPDFTDQGNMTFHSPIVPYEKLTDAEKMALYGLVAPNRFGACKLSDFSLAIVGFHLDHGRPPAGPWELAAFGAACQDADSPDNLPYELGLWWASPITGKPFDFTKTEFSPGNGYLQVVTDPHIVEYFTVRDAQYYDPHRIPPMPRVAERHLVYVRLYGVTGVIAEGIKPWYRHTSGKPAGATD